MLECRKREMKKWEIKNNKLSKVFSFADFVSAIKFVNAVAELAEKENHHPDISIKYNYVELILWTHDIGSITEKDRSLASKVDKIRS